MKKSAIALLAAVVLGPLFSGHAVAAPVPGVLDQSNAPGTITISTNSEVAQTFTAGKSGLLTRVALWMDQADSSAHTLIRILTTSGGTPTNQQIGSSGTSYPAGAADWVYFDLETPAPVSAGTQYAIMFSTNFGGWTTRAYGSGDTYAAGRAFELDYSTGWGNPSTPGLLDFAFQTYVDPATTPAPTVPPTAPPTVTAAPTDGAGSGSIVWPGALFLGIVLGSAAYFRRRLAGAR
jgi:hypothetical protein